jgi:hypothetical protein
LKHYGNVLKTLLETSVSQNETDLVIQGVTPCSLVYIYQRFGGIYYFHLFGKKKLDGEHPVVLLIFDCFLIEFWVNV